MKTFIGFNEALELTLAHVATCGVQEVALLQAVGRTLAGDIVACVDSPSISTSRKDGFAVVSRDLDTAASDAPVALKLAGTLSAGDTRLLRIAPGATVRVTTGARLPDGADAVLAEEFCRVAGDVVICTNTAGAGRNILRRGTDVTSGAMVAGDGEKLSPPLIGLIAAAGHGTVTAHRPPRAAVIATGEEVVAPGAPLPEGKLYASNMVAICGWLAACGIPFETAIVRDRRDDIRAAIQSRLARTDVFLTSGGAWGSEKDLILQVLETLKWTGIYHRVRMGPGKPVGFGLLERKPFFVLPGGPPSNEMAFLQLALPALLKMKGDSPRVFPVAPARLAATVTGEKGWTEFVHARLETRSDGLHAHPARLKSRLVSMAAKQALIVIPEDRAEIAAGETIEIQVLDPFARGTEAAAYA
jgi:molybdopterin molybdotransferase